jgi:hypothetical protein
MLRQRPKAKALGIEAYVGEMLMIVMFFILKPFAPWYHQPAAYIDIFRFRYYFI